MERLTTPDGITISYDQGGSGPALVLVHGAFSDHHLYVEAVRAFLLGPAEIPQPERVRVVSSR